MKIYFVLTHYQLNAKSVFSLSHPQEFLIYFLFLFLSLSLFLFFFFNRAKLGRSLLVCCGFLQKPSPAGLISHLQTKPTERSPLRRSGSPNGSCRWCRGLLSQQTCSLFPIPLLVRSKGAPHPKLTQSSDVTRGPARVCTQSTC